MNRDNCSGYLRKSGITPSIPASSKSSVRACGGNEFGLAVQIGTLSLPGNPHVETEQFDSLQNRTAAIQSLPRGRYWPNLTDI
jgi:hypothetical protein